MLIVSCTGSLDVWCSITIEMPENLNAPIVLLSGIGPNEAVLSEELAVTANYAAGLFRWLRPGIWSFTAQVLENEIAVLSGSVESEIKVGRPTLVDIILEPVTGSTDIIVTIPDDIPPSNVSNALAVPAAGPTVDLSFDNPTGDVDFVGVSIWRSTTFFPGVPVIAEGEEIYEGSGVAFTDDNVVSGESYYYTIFSYDAAVPRNYSSGVMKDVTLP